MKLKIGGGCQTGLKSYKQHKSLGYDCVDFFLADTRQCWYTLEKEKAEALLLMVKSFAEQAEVELHQCHGPWISSEIYKTPLERTQRMNENKHSLWCASVLGIKNWVIHPIFPFGTDDNGGTMRDECFKINYDFYSELLETAKKYDITICYENMPFQNFCLSEIDSIKKMVDKINDEHFKICLDTGHTNCFKTRNLGDAVNICGKDLKVLHIHDNHGRDSHEIPYFGTADWDSFYNGLVDIGYNGVFNYEAGPNRRMGTELYEDVHRLMIRIARKIMHDF